MIDDGRCDSDNFCPWWWRVNAPRVGSSVDASSGSRDKESDERGELHSEFCVLNGSKKAV